MSAGRAVVIADGAEGLYVAAALAERDIEVRVLGRWSGLPSDMAGVTGLADGEATRLVAQWGATVSATPPRYLWLDGERRPMVSGFGGATRSLGRGRARAAVSLALGRLDPREDARAACKRMLGRGAARHVGLPLLERTFASEPRTLVPAAASWLFRRGPVQGVGPARPWAEVGQALISRVRARGGEVLDEVEIEGLECERGRVSAVLTGHGRELIDDQCWVAVDAHQWLNWLPDEVRAKPYGLLTGLRTARRRVVRIAGEGLAPGEVIYLCDGPGPWVRVGCPEPGVLAVEGVAAIFPSAANVAAQAVVALVGLQAGAVLSATESEWGVPLKAQREQRKAWRSAMAGVGCTGASCAALLRPLGLVELLDYVDAVCDGGHPVQALDALEGRLPDGAWLPWA